MTRGAATGATIGGLGSVLLNELQSGQSSEAAASSRGIPMSMQDASHQHLGIEHLMLQHLLQPRMQSGGETYEQLLDRFGDGLGDPGRVASQATTEALPTRKIERIGNDEESKNCAICMSPYCKGEEVKTLPCLHFYHTACIDHWLRDGANSCPICKHSVNL